MSNQMLTSQEVADRLRSHGHNYDASDVATFARRKIFPGAQKDKRGVWLIPEDEVNYFVERQFQVQAKHRKNNLWKWIVGIVGSFIASIAAILVFNSGLKDTLDLGRDYVAPLLNQSPELIPKIDQVLVGEAEDEYKFKLAISNSTSQDLLIREVEFGRITVFNQNSESCFPNDNDIGTSIYTSPYTRTILAPGNFITDFRTDINANDPDLVGYKASAKGSLVVSECDVIMRIAMEVSYVLKRNEHIFFTINVPKSVFLYEISRPNSNEAIFKVDTDDDSLRGDKVDDLFEFIVRTKDGQDMLYVIDLLEGYSPSPPRSNVDK